MKIIVLGAKNPETGRMIEAIKSSQSSSHERQEFVGFIDNNRTLWNSNFLGLPVLGGNEIVPSLISQGHYFVNTITGSTISRYVTSKFISEKGGKFVNFIHPSVNVPSKCGVGNYVQEGVYIQAAAEIGSNSSIHVGSVISHDVKIGNSSFIAHMVSVSGEVTIGDGVFIGTNATILPRLNIGNWATIGAGAVVTKDVPPYAVVVGNPGKILKFNETRTHDGKI